MEILWLVLIYALRLYSLVLLVRVLASWIDPAMQHPVSRFLVRVTEPVLAPVRRFLPRGGPVDWSPIVVFLLLTVLIQIIIWIS